jgi:hypothetical protein
VNDDDDVWLADDETHREFFEMLMEAQPADKATGHTKWRDIKHKGTPEGLAAARLELDVSIARHQEADPESSDSP